MRLTKNGNGVRAGERKKPLAFWPALLLVTLFSTESSAQFNARGRGPRAGTATKTTTPRSTGAKPTAALPEVDRDATLIARYEKLIFESPGEEVPLTRLAELVRKRDGNLDQLLASLEEKAETSGDKYAALVAWGGILAKDDQSRAAIERLTDATKIEPKRPEAWKLLGELQKATGNVVAARQSYENALPALSGPERSILIRSLRDLCLDAEDYDGASAYHKQLTKEAQGNLFLKGELGRELLRRGQTARAIEELEQVVESAHGDARALPPALKDLGEAELAAGRTKQAISTLKKASRLSVSSPGLRTAIDTLRAEAHRKDGSLGDFLEELESSAGTSPRLGLLGRLLEEEGHTERAVKAYEKALARSPQEIDLRLRLVRLYEVTGDIDKAVKEYGRLAKSSPRDVQLALRYAEMLLAQGERNRAIAELDRIDRLTSSDPEAGLLLLDFADRLEEKERSNRILNRLSQSKASDPRFLVELGSRYYQTGNTEAAHRTWKRIVTVGKDRSRSYLTYGEVLLDHEASDEGVKALREAVKLAPRDLRAKKTLALGLERAAAQDETGPKNDYEREALDAWKNVLTESTVSTDPTSASTSSLARRHIVRLWKRMGLLNQSLPPLEKKLAKEPPDLEAGRLLAEAYVATRSDRRAAEVLSRVLTFAPGDRSSLLLLESVHTRSGNHKEAISVLERLVEADPRRAREYYERMARAAAARNDRTRALQYAELAVEKSPTDPAAQASLGDLYLNQGRLKEAEAAYRRALSQDDRLHHVSLQLADILAKTDRSTEALDVLFHVTRSARSLEAVGTAARRAISVSLPLGAARRVEDVLRPLAISHPQTPIYRTVLLEVLSSQMYPLLLERNHGDATKRRAAQEELRALADRSTGPLLLSLSGKDQGQQQVAISLLAHSSKKSASSGLLAFAEGSGPEEQRLLSILALGEHGSNELGDRLSDMVAHEGTPRRGRVPRAAAWALSRSGGTRAIPTLLIALKSGDPELRAYAALGIADQDTLSPGQRKDATTTLRTILLGPEHGELARGAAALALGKLGRSAMANAPERQEDAEALLVASYSPSELVGRCAILALSQIDKGPETRARIAEGLLAPSDDVRESATLAATLLLEGTSGESTALLPAELRPGEMDARLRIKDALELSPKTLPTARRHQAMLFIANELKAQGKVALRSSASTASAALSQIHLDGGNVLFGRLVLASDLKSSEPTLSRTLATTESLRLALKEEIIALSTGPNPELTTQALLTLRPSDGPEATNILLEKLQQPQPEVHAAALLALLKSPTPDALKRLAPYLKSEPSWGRRRRLAGALKAALATPLSADSKREVEGLLATLAQDENPLVRAEAQQ